MNLDKNLLKLLKQSRLTFTVSILLGTLSAIAIILKAKILSQVLDSVFLKNAVLSGVLNSLILFAVISLIHFLFVWGKEWAASKTSQKIKINLRNKLLDQLYKLGPVYCRRESTGELSNTITTGVDAIDSYFSQYLPELFLGSIIPVSILIFIFPIDLLSAIIFLITAPIIPFFMVLIGSIADKLTKKQWKLLSKLSSHFLDVFQGITTLKMFGKSRQQINEIKSISDQFRKSTMKVLKVAFLSALSLEILSTISTAIIAVQIGLRLLYAEMNFADAMFILILAPEFYLPLRRLGARFHAGMESVAAAQRIYTIFENTVITGKNKSKLLQTKDDFKIEFSDVSYTYQNESKPALTNINLNLEPGKVTALVGPSGAGKTTIANLLLGFIIPSKGEILVNNQNIVINEWRQHISWISQDPFIFHASIRDNIQMANHHSEKSDIVEAAKAANIHEFISGLPLGYDTIVGEKGTKLSGGQKQRIALARAFLKNSRILILDEPTSNLDPAIEEMVQKSIQNLARNKTVLLIAHKLKTVKMADTIYMISDGMIQEQGNHNTLMTNKKNYYRLIKNHEQHLLPVI